MEKNIFTKKPTTLKKIWPYIVKDVACCCIYSQQQSKEKKRVKGEKNIFSW